MTGRQAITVVVLIAVLVTLLGWQFRDACEDDMGGTFHNWQCTVPPTQTTPPR